MDTIEDRVNKIAQQWQQYCLPDKTQQIKPQINQLAQQIDRLLSENNESKKEKAKLNYLKGKVLDLLPSYQKSAQQFLTKAVKLNPENGDCWNVLAHVLFKKGDYKGASQAVSMAIQSKGPNKVSLRYQSVLLRVQGTLAQEKRKNYEDSLKIMKQALMMDLKDWQSWYFLGNAYFSNFVANYKKLSQLELAIKAYNQSQKYLTIKYPDLFLNRANVQAHLELYEKAIVDLEKAHAMDTSLGADETIQNIQKRMLYTRTAFQRASELKKNKIDEIVKTIPNSVNKNSPQSKFQIVAVKSLKQNENPDRMISTKIISKLTQQKDIPASFLAIDSQGNFLCISVYNVKPQAIDQKIKKDTLLTIGDPHLKKIKFNGFEYDSVQANDFSKIWVDRKNLTFQDFNPNTVYNQTFQK